MITVLSKLAHHHTVIYSPRLSPELFKRHWNNDQIENFRIYRLKGLLTYNLGWIGKFQSAKLNVPYNLWSKMIYHFLVFSMFLPSPCVFLKMFHSTMIGSCETIFAIINHKTMFSTESWWKHSQAQVALSWKPRQHWLSGALTIFTLKAFRTRVSWNCRCYLRQIASTQT